MRLVDQRGDEVRVGKLVQSAEGRVGKIQAIIGPTEAFPSGAISILWSGEHLPAEILPREISAAFR
jgi:hypothetical protein